jgi:hypothetical protein
MSLKKKNATKKGSITKEMTIKKIMTELYIKIF